ncbi:MAG: hypothetical protein HOQ05_10390 [Corynebacteriales bacterium]|nr:hypothetical protein [Mycobacteriales bacterium]
MSSGVAVVRTRIPVGNDAGFVRDLATAEEGFSGRARLAFSGFMRNWTRRIALLLLTLTAVGTIGVGVQEPAQSVDWFDFAIHWCDRKDLNPQRPGEGVEGLLDGMRTTDPNWAKEEWTTWQRYGMAGTYWTTYGQDCWGGIPNMAITGLSNMIFYIPRIIATLVIYFFQWTFDGDVIKLFLEPIEREGFPDGEPAIDIVVESLHLELYAHFFALVVVVAALVLFWRSIIQGAGMADFLSKFVIMVCVAGALSFFAVNGAATVSYFNNVTNGLTKDVFAAFSAATCRAMPGATKADCQKPDDSGGTQAVDSVMCPSGSPGGKYTVYAKNTEDFEDAAEPTGKEEREFPKMLVAADPIDCIGQVFYQALIFVPWANGVAGPLNESPEPLDEDGKGTSKAPAGDAKEKWKTAYQILMYQAYGRDEADIKSDFARDDADYNRKYIRDGLLFGKWGVNPNFSAKDDDYGELTGQAGDNADAFKNMSGGNGEARFTSALMALIGTLALSFVLFLVALFYLILELATVILAMVAPLAMLIGIIPTFGLKIFLKWLEMFVGTFLKRIGLAVFVGLIMALYTFILTLQISWFAHIIITLGIAIVGMVYGKKLIEMAGGGGVVSAGTAAAKLTGQAGVGTAKGTVKGAIGTQRGARMMYQGAKANWEASRFEKDKYGNKVGKLRRGASAFYAGARGAGAAARTGGTVGQKMSYAKSVGKNTHDRVAKRRKYGVDQQRKAAYDASIAAGEQAIENVQAQRAERRQMAGKNPVSRGMARASGRRTVNRIQRAAERENITKVTRIEENYEERVERIRNRTPSSRGGNRGRHARRRSNPNP